jgi:DNA polymerase-1
MKSIISSHRDISEFLEKVSACKKYGIDVEATSSFPRNDAPLQHDMLQIVGIGFGFSDGSKTYFPFAHSEGPQAPPEAFEAVKRVLEDPVNEAWAYNMKYEYMALRSFGIEVKAKLYCSQIAQFALGKQLPGQGGLKLKPAARKYLGMKMKDWTDVVPDGTRAHEVSSLKVGDYCGDDSLAALRLGELWVPELESYGALKAFREMSCEFAKVLVHMREVGFAIDRDKILDLDVSLREEEANIVEEFESIVGVHPNKNQAVSRILFKEMKVWPVLSFMKEGNNHEFSIDAKIRKKIRERLRKGSKGMRIMDLKDRHSKISKFISNYTLSLIEKADRSLDGRLRCEFNQNRAATGRLASSNPNLQNIPNPKKFGGEIRGAFISEEGWAICDADYSQADLRMMAHLSQDENLMKAYIEDIDLHQQTADGCHCGRGTGKVLNLGIIYEMMPRTLAANLGISIPEAQVIWRRWHSIYPRVQEYQKRMHLYVAERGYVKTITGRLRFIPKGYIKVDLNVIPVGMSPSTERIRIIAEDDGRRYGAPFREASNTPCQGSVADVLMIAGRNLYREWKERGVLYDYWTGEGKAKILSFVHDETICELREDFIEEGAADIQRHMENAVKLRVPMKAGPGVGRSWIEAYKDGEKKEKAA